MEFKIVTDCNSLRATFEKKDLIPRVARWWGQLQEFNCNIEYRPGVKMAHADALSRNPVSNNETSNDDDESCIMMVNTTDWLATIQTADPRHIMNAVATPRANGQVERYNRTITEALAAANNDGAENKWDEHVAKVQWSLNNTLNKGIGRTPAEVLFGIKMTGIADSRLSLSLQDDVKVQRMDREPILQQVSEHIGKQQAYQKHQYDKRRTEAKKYKVGDLVRVQRHHSATGQSRKLLPKFQGPYRITKVFDHDRYEVEDTPLTKKRSGTFKSVVAVDKLQPWVIFDRFSDDESGKQSSDSDDDTSQTSDLSDRSSIATEGMKDDSYGTRSKLRKES
ncbi:hypothetical protein MSG28_005453 [Choristoneura fumiferana]|uniref:Uncharacterized protein n=1 Tax=Choristoneura fumiferana TaxID=7141 RepID=A0ACC0KYW0_CHOFU|nr:hypothetical protein MSG28_005453 [Choristoneura fumiferana]